MTQPQYDTGGSISKIDIINGAYSKMRISGLTTNPIPEEIELALQTLENVAAEWFSRNMDGGYSFEDEPDPNSPAGIPRAYSEAYQYQLAYRLLSDFNKQVPPSFMTSVSAAVSNLSAREALVRPVDYSPRNPRGSGNQRWNPWRRYFRPQDKAPLSDSTKLGVVGNVNDYVLHFDSYLKADETIESFTIEVSSGLSLQSSSNNSPDIDYRVKFTDNGRQTVTVSITTSDGRIETKVVNFNASKAEDL